jgi:hypothetical protein
VTPSWPGVSLDATNRHRPGDGRADRTAPMMAMPLHSF